MSTMKNGSRHADNNFDTLRLFFAVLVIFSHSFALGRGSDNGEPLFLLTRGQITLGNLSVWAFFVISGFLIAQSWMRSPNPLKFLKRRVARIYPGFIVAALLSALVLVPIAANPATRHPVAIGSFLLQTLRLQVFDAPPIFIHNAWPNTLNGSLWSVPFEFWCYIGILLLGVAGMLRRRWLVAASRGGDCMASLFVHYRMGSRRQASGNYIWLPAILGCRSPILSCGVSISSLWWSGAASQASYDCSSCDSDRIELHPACIYSNASGLRRISSPGSRLSSLAASAEPGAIRRFFLWHLSVCLSDSAVDCELWRGNNGAG